MIWRTLKWLVTPQRRPLSEAQPKMGKRDVPLGMEAIDMNEVRRTQRRNESLERSHTSMTDRTSRGFLFEQAADTDIEPLADDETYAKRYHTAFQKRKDKDRK